MESSLDLPPNALASSWNSLRQRGNLSSASVLTVMQDFLENHPGGPGCYSMMGAGNGVLLRATPAAVVMADERWTQGRRRPRLAGFAVTSARFETPASDAEHLSSPVPSSARDVGSGVSEPVAEKVTSVAPDASVAWVVKVKRAWELWTAGFRVKPLPVMSRQVSLHPVIPLTRDTE